MGKIKRVTCWACDRDYVTSRIIPNHTILCDTCTPKKVTPTMSHRIGKWNIISLN